MSGSLKVLLGRAPGLIAQDVRDLGQVGVQVVGHLVLWNLPGNRGKMTRFKDKQTL